MLLPFRLLRVAALIDLFTIKCKKGLKRWGGNTISISQVIKAQIFGASLLVTRISKYLPLTSLNKLKHNKAVSDLKPNA